VLGRSRLGRPIRCGLADGPADLALERRFVWRGNHWPAVGTSRRRKDAARSLFVAARLSGFSLGTAIAGAIRCDPQPEARSQAEIQQDLPFASHGGVLLCKGCWWSSLTLLCVCIDV